MGLIGVSVVVHSWSSLAGDTLLSVALILGLLPPVFYLWVIRRPARRAPSDP